MNKNVRGLLIGFVSGLAVALGGAIKDAPYEGFELKKFVRSPIIGALEGLVLFNRYDIPNEVGFFTVIGTERLTVETWKLLRSVFGNYKPMKFTYGEWGSSKY